MLDRLIIEFDRGLRTLLAESYSARPYPAHDQIDNPLEAKEKRHAAALMRVNHCGEVCAQALYNGQAATAQNPHTASALHQASIEETEHLAWCESRIKELGSHKSLLTPLFYTGSFALGAVAGALGDKWNLGFLAETERQVGKHLTEHLSKLPEQDARSRAILQQMQLDEARHAESAIRLGGEELPKPVKVVMRAISKIMTRTTYYL